MARYPGRALTVTFSRLTFTVTRLKLPSSPLIGCYASKPGRVETTASRTRHRLTCLI